jgi:hypothetical protein
MSREARESFGGVGKMRHKWMAILVVMFTTLTTAQEAFKQYDAFKTEAAEWATLSLWTGFLSADAPQSAPLQAQLTNCDADQPRSHAQQPYAPALARTIRVESIRAHKQDSSTPSINVEVLALDDDRHKDSFEAGREALARIREVELLGTPDRETGEPFEHRSLRAEPFGPLPELNTADLTVHALQRVRQAAEDEAAPLAAVADSEAALRQTRDASRTQAQKNRAMKRALKVLQLRVDKAVRQELSWDKSEITVDWPNGLNIALGARGGPNSIAASLPLPLAPPQPVALPAPVAGFGGCAGE